MDIRIDSLKERPRRLVFTEPLAGFPMLSELAGREAVAIGSELRIEVVAELEDLLGRTLEVRHEPERAGEVRHSQAANDRLMALFPHAAAVPLRDGLAATVEWMRTQVAGAR